MQHFRKLQLMTSGMDRIIALSESSPQIHEIDPDRFATFMQRKPIWLHFSITQDIYLRKTNEEKTRMISEYYNYLVKGKRLFFLFVLAWSFEVLLRFALSFELHFFCNV